MNTYDDGAYPARPMLLPRMQPPMSPVLPPRLGQGGASAAKPGATGRARA